MLWILVNTGWAVPHAPYVHYRFDGSGSIATEENGTGYDLDLTFCAQNAGGALNGITGADWNTNLRCNAIDSRAVGPNAPDFDTPDFSIATWVRVNNLLGCNNDECTLASKHRRDAGVGGYWLSLSGAQLRLTLANDVDEADVFSPNVYFEGDWTFVVATVEGSVVTLYEDGLQVAQQDVGFQWAPDPTPFRVAAVGDRNYGLNGRVDELTMYDRALDPAEVMVLYDWFIDDDGDGLAGDDDCNDADPFVSGPTLTWFDDADGDGFGAGIRQYGCAEPAASAAVDGDCNDAEPAVNPGIAEVCNGIDDNCDGAIDETGAPIEWYPDLDADGFGAGVAVVDCVGPAGHVDNADDCDDADDAINPLADEVCDAQDVDEDCNGLADDADPGVLDAVSRYADDDADGFGAEGSAAVLTCETVGFADTATDCDDTDAAVNPGATEVCDPLDVDEDCNGLADDADPGVQGAQRYEDADSDGYGDAPIASCDLGVALEGDCDDARSDVNPGVTEIWYDGTDQNCDGNDDDQDFDGFPGGPGGVDCADSDAAINPDAMDMPDDGIDQDCDGLDAMYVYGNGLGCQTSSAPSFRVWDLLARRR